MTTAVRLRIQRRLSKTWIRIVRVGAVAALGQVFVALSGMPVRLDVREIVVPVLSLGYVVVLVAPLVVGLLLARRPEHEAFLEKPPSRRDLLVGATVGGLIAGGGLSM